ncbi:hypothetical protein D3C85_693240 [compost metagenome]
MTTINDLEQINTMAMMTMCELGYARYERFLSKLELNDDAGDQLRRFINDWVEREHELELRIRVAPMRRTMQ